MSYIVAGYIITLSTLAIYSASLLVRLRRAKGRQSGPQS